MNDQGGEAWWRFAVQSRLFLRREIGVNDLHSARYQASRPWAKRVAQLFTQARQQEEACTQAAQLVQRELAQLASLYSINDTQRETEFVLAEAYGLFVRDGRRVYGCDTELAAALRHTRPLAALPAQLALPEGTFLLSLPGEQGDAAAYVTHRAADKRLDILLLTPDFAPAGVPCHQRMEAALTLGVHYPDSVSVPDSPALASWKPWLEGVFAVLAVLALPKVQQAAQWLPAPSAAEQQQLDAGNARDRQKARASLLKAGAQEVQLLQLPGLAPLPAEGVRAGYWRTQASKDGDRLVWVPPRANG